MTQCDLFLTVLLSKLSLNSYLLLLDGMDYHDEAESNEAESNEIIIKLDQMKKANERMQ